MTTDPNICTHDSGHRWQAEPDRRETYPEALDRLYESFDAESQEIDRALDLLADIAQGNVEAPRAAAAAFIREHYPNGRLAGIVAAPEATTPASTP